MRRVVDCRPQLVLPTALDFRRLSDTLRAISASLISRAGLKTLLQLLDALFEQGARLAHRPALATRTSPAVNATSARPLESSRTRDEWGPSASGTRGRTTVTDAASNPTSDRYFP
jgi:hypothetical protein